MTKKKPSIWRWVKETYATFARRPFALFWPSFLTTLVVTTYQYLAKDGSSPVLILLAFCVMFFFGPYLSALEMVTARHVVDEKLPAHVGWTWSTIWSRPRIVRHFLVLGLLRGLAIGLVYALCMATVVFVVVANRSFNPAIVVLILLSVLFFLAFTRSFWCAAMLVVDAEMTPWKAIKTSVGLYFKHFFKFIFTDFFVGLGWAFVATLAYFFETMGVRAGALEIVWLSFAALFIATVFLNMMTQISGYLYYRDLCENTHHFPAVVER